MDQKIVPNLWFDTEAEEAAEFYCSVFEDSRIVAKTHYGEGAPREAGMVMTVAFELHGQRFVGINGGPEFRFDEVRGSFVWAVSRVVVVSLVGLGLHRERLMARAAAHHPREEVVALAPLRPEPDETVQSRGLAPIGRDRVQEAPGEADLREAAKLA
jgi:hypothetical protein